MREIRLITFCCYDCGCIVKGYMNTNGSITFEIIGKLHSGKDVLTESGYFKCPLCHTKTNIRFEYVYK